MFIRKTIQCLLAFLLAIPVVTGFSSQATAAVPIVGETIALKSLSSDRYVCVEGGGTLPTIANRPSIGSWEKYIVRDAGGGLYALEATVNSKYMSKQANNQFIANASTIGINEKFEIADAGGNNVSIKSAANGLYWTVNPSDFRIYASQTTVGTAETFEKIVLSAPVDTSGPHYLGVTFGFTERTMSGTGGYYNQGNQILNLPMYKATTDEAKFWDNYVEELVSSGVDFVAPTIRGYVDLPLAINTAGDPRMLSGLVAAINRRGAGDKLKISALDDTPASMTDKKNRAKHGTGGYDPKFDIGDVDGTGEGGYAYFWDRNLRAFFETVPDNLRFKIDGRPVIYEWGIGDFAFTNQGNGNLKKLVEYVRDKADEEFGINPYLIVDQSWIAQDPTVASVVDGVHSWFPVPGGKSVTAFNGKNFGVAVPSFRYSVGSTHMEITPNHGQTFKDNLAATVPISRVTLIEGFTDWEENAATWRGREGDYNDTWYDYPNQMINILRQYSNNPFPTDLRVEAESADFYYDTTPGNHYNVYRDGDLDVQETGDIGGGWNVGNTAAGEWLEWREIPLQGTVTLKIRAAAANSGNRVRFVVDGIAGPTITIPNTGGMQTYQTVPAGSFTFAAGSYHTVRLELVDGDVNINYWTN